MKTVLVVGGAGFVGSHLCDALMAQGNFVIALDNLSTGNKNNIAHLSKNKNFKFIKADIVEFPLPPSFLKKGNSLAEIYHLASPASPVQYQKNPVSTWKANTLGTLNLLELAKKHKAKFLFASTSEVYGDPKEHPQKESYWGNVNPIGIRSCYDESKRAGETLCIDFKRKYKVDIKIARIFNTYGPRMDQNDGRVVSNFIVQALLHKPITIYGKGNQTRSFQYVEDLVSAFIKLVSKNNFIGPVNLGNPQEFTILELAKAVIYFTKSKSKITFKPLPEDDPKQRQPDISLARKKLLWSPKVTLKEGLPKTIAYFREKLKLRA